MNASFVHQLRWELAKLWARPRSHLGVAACLLVEIALIALYRFTTLEELLGTHYWRVPEALADGFSGLTAAVHVTSETMAVVAPLFLALVAGDIVANDVEERTLHMMLSRPVTRETVLAQKLLACSLYTGVLALVVGVTALGLGLFAHGPGPLILVSAREGIIGIHEFSAGMARYTLSILILGFCCLTFTLMAFALSCWRMKPGAAAVTAGAIVVTDQVIRVMPGLSHIAPYCLTTRLLTWRQVLHDEIPWLKIERNLSELFYFDVALILLAWWVFRRRELAP